MQIMKYSWKQESNGFEPVMTFSDGTKMKMLGRHISMEIGEKTCTGYNRDGKHYECPSGTKLDYGYMCNVCRLNDDFFNCIQCTGKECINLKQRDSCMENNYFIYLAAFDRILKVGISFERRLLERLIEQGADFGAKIAYINDGKEVRRIEQEIRKHLEIVDRVVSKEKHDNLFCNPNNCIQLISSAMSKLKNSGFSRYLIRPEIYDLRNYYRMENVMSEPSRAEAFDGMVIDGTVIAAKGNIIILSNSGLTAVNAHRLIGRQAIIYKETQFL